MRMLISPRSKSLTNPSNRSQIPPRAKTLVFGDRFPSAILPTLTLLLITPPSRQFDTSGPSAATVAFLIDKVKAEGIPVVFHIEFSNEKMADTIAEATGAQKSCCCIPATTLPKAEFASGVTYLALMRQNAKT
jgi:zinc transport system substrate-binding protein